MLADESLTGNCLITTCSYAAIGGIFFHMGQYRVALNFFEKALSVREDTLGDLHMDTALLFNNIGCCYDMLNRVTEGR